MEGKGVVIYCYSYSKNIKTDKSSLSIFCESTARGWWGGCGGGPLCWCMADTVIKVRSAENPR